MVSTLLVTFCFLLNGFILFEKFDFFGILNAFMYYSNKVFLFPFLPVFLELKLMIVVFLHVDKDCHHATHYKLYVGEHQAYAACDSLCDVILNNNTQIKTFKVTHYILFSHIFDFT